MAFQSLVARLIGDRDVPRLEAVLDSIEKRTSRSEVLELLRANILEVARVGDVSVLEVFARRYEAASGGGVPLLFDVQDSDRHTPLFTAAHGGHAAMVRALVRAGAGHVANKLGRTPLWIAACKGYAEVCAEILKGRESWSSEDLPLAEAAYFGHAEVCSTLLGAGAARNADNATGRTPLCLAASMGHTAVVRLLMERFGDPEDGHPISDLRTIAHQPYMYSPLYAALYYGKVETAMYLWPFHRDRKYCGEETFLHLAAWRGDASVCELLIRHPSFAISPNVEDARGMTPISLASHAGHEATFKSLITLGADVNLPNRKGCSALFEVVVRNPEDDPVKLKLLLEAGALNFPNSSGITAAHSAALWNRPRCLRLLLDRFPEDLDRQTAGLSGNTLLHLAAKRGNAGICEELLRRGARQLPNERGEFPFSLAIKRGAVEACDVFIRTDAYRHQPGETPLYTAAMWGEVGVCKLLMDRGILC